MLDLVYAARFVRVMGSGRNSPCLIACDTVDGEEIELVVKCSHGLYENEKNLCIEAIAAMLAADLGLPVPEPFIVDLAPEFISDLKSADAKAKLQASCRIAFGSKFLPPGFSLWTRQGTVPAVHCQLAAEVFVFDTIIINSDRLTKNPNCLYSGDSFAIIDHELALSFNVLFWHEPWTVNGFDAAEMKPEGERHIFSRPYLEVCPQQLDRFVQAWQQLPPERFKQYEDALPDEWKSKVNLKEIFDYLETARQNITLIVNNAIGVLG
ncbi:HipA family kinase [Cupriavidus necator]